MIRVVDETIYVMTTSEQLRLTRDWLADERSPALSFEDWLRDVRKWPKVTTYQLEHP